MTETTKKKKNLIFFDVETTKVSRDQDDNTLFYFESNDITLLFLPNNSFKLVSFVFS
jgi:hypothetical protein